MYRRSSEQGQTTNIRYIQNKVMPLRFRLLLGLALLVPIRASCPAWSVTPADFAESMSVTAYLTWEDGSEISSPLVALVDGQIRGLANSPDTVPVGPYAGKLLHQITIYGDSPGGAISFRVCAGSQGYIADTTSTLTFTINGVEGSATEPVLLTFPASPSDSSESTACKDIPAGTPSTRWATFYKGQPFGCTP